MGARTLSRRSASTAHPARKLLLTGAAGCFASTPDHASLDITGDLDIRVDLAMTDWTPTAAQTLIGKYLTTGNQRSYRLRVNTTGTLDLIWTTTGVTAIVVASTVPIPATDGARLGVRATIDVDDGAGNHVVTFYTSPDFVAWTQLGDPVSTVGTTSIHSGSSPMEIGLNSGASERLVGRVWRAEVRNGIAGTVVASPDFQPASAGSASVTDAQGRVFTLQGTAVIA